MGSNIAASIKGPIVQPSGYGNFPQYVGDAAVILSQNMPNLSDQQNFRTQSTQ